MLGIFSGLFSKNTENKSHIRKWVKQEIETVDMVNPDVYAIFVGLIHTGIQWGKYNSEEQEHKFAPVAKAYLGDATIYEIVCYTYLRVENWLVSNQPELTSEIAIPISKWITEKSALTFYLDEQWVSQLFKEQLARYQVMIDAGQSLEEIHLAVEQRIVMTKGDKFDQKYRPQDPASMALDSQYIKFSLEEYEKNHLSILIEGIQDYCSKHTKKQLSQQQNQQEKQGQQDYVYAMALVGQQDWVRACKAFDKVLAANPKHYEALVQRGLIHVALQQPMDAVQDFSLAIKINPNQPAPYLYRAKCYHRNFRQKTKSVTDYSAAIALAPKNAAGYFGRGELYDEIALVDEKQAVEKNDHTQDAVVSEDLLAAISDYSQVIVLEPEHDGAYTNRGLVYARKARLNKNVDFIVKSIADFERAMSLNWENGYLYKQQDEMKQLLEEVSQ